MSRYSLFDEEGKGWECVRRSPQIGLIASCGSLLAILLCAACDLGPRGPVLDLRSRPDDAQTGAEIVRDIRSLDLEAREERIFSEISRGNVPTWLRRLRPVAVRGEGGGRSPGWHHPDGQPIQRLSSSRQDDWVAVSHGIRLVDRGVLVSGVPRDLADVLADPELPSLLSREGVIPQVRYPTMGGKR